MEHPNANDEATRQRRQRERLAKLEADMAYFQARLEMIREVKSANRMAQHKVFVLLNEHTAGAINEIKRASNAEKR